MSVVTVSSSSVSLGNAILDLVPTGLAPSFEVRVPPTQRPPWFVSSVKVPHVAERALARRPQVNHATLLVKCVAGTGQGARAMLAAVQDAVEGVRPVADGWLVSPLEQINVRWDPTEGTSVVVAGATLPVFEAIVEFRCAASRVSGG